MPEESAPIPAKDLKEIIKADIQKVNDAVAPKVATPEDQELIKQSIDAAAQHVAQTIANRNNTPTDESNT